MPENVFPPETAAGEVWLRDLPAASPTWPQRLSPQQYAAPPDAIAHVWALPEAMLVNVNPPATA